MNTQNQNNDARPSGQSAAGTAYQVARSILSAQPAPVVLLQKATGNPEPEVGQVWHTKPVPVCPPGLSDRIKTDEPFSVVVLNVLPSPQHTYQVVTVAPILVEAEMAGPEDVLFPRSILGFEAAVAVGSAVGMLAGNLAECLGGLPSEWRDKIGGFRGYLQEVAESKPAGLQVGPEYLDKLDLRYRFHEKLVDRLEYLQQPYAAFLQRETACQPCGQSAGGYDMCPICGGQTYEV